MDLLLDGPEPEPSQFRRFTPKTVWLKPIPGMGAEPHRSNLEHVAQLIGSQEGKSETVRASSTRDQTMSHSALEEEAVILKGHFATNSNEVVTAVQLEKVAMH
jgi:hypothetical protein